MLIIDIKANIYAKYVHETISIEMEIIYHYYEQTTKMALSSSEREDVK